MPELTKLCFLLRISMTLLEVSTGEAADRKSQLLGCQVVKFCVLSEHTSLQCAFTCIMSACTISIATVTGL